MSYVARIFRRSTLLAAYRKFRSLLRGPVFATTDQAATSADVIEAPGPVHEAPDTSHVTPPIADLPAARDEALDLFSRRLDVMATRADRLERSVEALAPVRVADLPTRAELRAIESLAETTRERGELLERRLAETLSSSAKVNEAHAADRSALIDLITTIGRLEEKLRDASEELRDARDAQKASADSLSELRESLLSNDAARAVEFSRRLAGAYTVAVVALLAALVTLALLVAR